MEERFGTLQFPTPLTSEREKHYFKQLAGATGQDRTEIFELIVNHNLRLVLKIANGRYREAVEDAFSCGMIGLIEAIKRFEFARGHKFSTYATHWVRQAIGRGMKNDSMVRLPSHIHELLRKLRNAARAQGLLMEEVTAEQICQLVSCRPATASTLLGVIDLEIFSSDHPDWVEKPRLESMIDWETDKSIVKSEYRETLKKAIKQLSPTERLIIKRHFFEEETLAKINATTDLSIQVIRTTLYRACKKLGHILGDPP